MKISVLLALLPLIQGLDFQSFDKSVLSRYSFFEQFSYKTLEESDWIASKSKKNNDESYVGKWSIEPPLKYPGIENDNGLVMKSGASHHAISRKFETVFENTNNDLVLQYEVKHQNGLTCGGGYIKLLNKDFEPENFSTSTPFQLMFGPDKCGENDQVKLILNRLNPITGEYEEKHVVDTSLTRSGPLSTLYTLILKKNHDFEIRVNGGVAKYGNLLDEGVLNPPLTPPKVIIDNSESKPLDWEELEFIPDESVTKPEDYDELYLNAFMPDPTVSKPEGWLDDEPQFIVDPFAEQPALWDEDEDGKWQPPIIPNPKCLPGCGKFNQPLIPNKNYKGPWIQPVVKNPHFIGEWTPKQIINPHYYEDNNPTNFEPIGGLGFDLWTIENDVLFDNIYLGHSIQEAETIGNETFKLKFDLESENYQQNKPKAIKGPSPPPKSFEEILNDDNTSTFQQVYLFFFLVFKRELLNMKDWWYDFNTDPLATVMNDPLRLVVYSGVFVFIFTLFFGTVSIVSFLITDWAKETKQAISTAQAELKKEDKEVPKIVELDDSDKPITTSSESSQSKPRRRH
ncbi:calnexin homolog [[Candida] jaroonii]|uniref:Calnexin homolog n=1 Tax=[Candida] jaroonii TaxID=467808 RepID=A0ACA9YA14_9ASCO|nr:calnexin homolog [[Candida] jaroonii]